MSDKKIRVGVIGAGSIAQIAHLPLLASESEVELTALYSRTYERALESGIRYGAKKVCRTFGEFLDTDLDCAVLLTPKTVRSEYIVPLLDKKLDILCEKPLAMTMKDADFLANVSKKSGQIIMVAFNRRFAPANVKSLEAFGDQRPHLVVAMKSREFREYRATVENAIHMVDLLRHVLGECDTVEAKGIFSDPFYEDLCTAQLEFKNGGIGLLAASRQAGQWREQVEMYGHGITTVSDNLDSYKVIYPDHEEGQSFTPLNKGWCTVVNRLGFENCHKHFFHCVKIREQPLTNAEDAFKTHELLDRILRAAGLPDLSKEWGAEKV